MEASSRTSCAVGIGSKYFLKYASASLRPLRMRTRESGPMPEYTIPMFFVSAQILLTELLSIRGASFFSVAITTPLRAISCQHALLQQANTSKQSYSVSPTLTFDSKRGRARKNCVERIFDLNKLAGRAECGQGEAVLGFAHAVWVSEACTSARQSHKSKADLEFFVTCAN
jgi:hypothetical protein